ncbi:hypothetical protein AAMO2058_001312000 [Amorphochlora amoebiformis]
MQGDFSLLSLAKDEDAEGQQTEHFSAQRFVVMGEYHQRFRKKFKSNTEDDSPLKSGLESANDTPVLNGLPGSAELGGISGGTLWHAPTYQVSFRPWRQRMRMRTTSVVLVNCLNIGYAQDEAKATEGGDGIQQKKAVMQAWIEPLSIQPLQDAGRAIGEALQRQFQRWQPRAVYQPLLDPTVSEVKRAVTVLRRGAAQDRVLLHYNGHGVPQPTANGEIWVFNRHYTQYIPLSVFDLFMWTSVPAIYVLDCPCAGLIIDAYNRHPRSEGKTTTTKSDTGTRGRRLDQEVGSPPEVIILAACGAQEALPMDPGMPADLFTSCLTTPLKVALRWTANRQQLTRVTEDTIQRLPGKHTDRKTPLGELNWIFTAVTDAIAWTTLSPELFHHLFRQDVLVSSLFRNFLLACRVFGSYGRTPLSLPALPPLATGAWRSGFGSPEGKTTGKMPNSSSKPEYPQQRTEHPMWEFWDVAVEFCMAQLERHTRDIAEGRKAAGAPPQFEPNPFFSQQLQAFRVWLRFGSVESAPPPQLPIVLQVLLSQTHRIPALLLLAEFVDRGPWAVNLALGVGVFPYFLKLLQSPGLKVRRLLVFIWTKILALDRSCQADLLKDRHHLHFASHLDADPSHVQKCFSLFVLSKLCDRSRDGQTKILFPHGVPSNTSAGPASPMMPRMNSTPPSSVSKHAQNTAYRSVPKSQSDRPGPPNGKRKGNGVRDLGLFRIVVDIFQSLQEGKSLVEEEGKDDSNGATNTTSGSLPLLRRWLALAVGKAWEAYNIGKSAGIAAGIHKWLMRLLSDPVSEVRTAAVFALGLLISPNGERPDQEALELAVGERLARLSSDASALVRREVVIALGHLCYQHRKRFVRVATLTMPNQPNRSASRPMDITNFSRPAQSMASGSPWRQTNAGSAGSAGRSFVIHEPNGGEGHSHRLSDEMQGTRTGHNVLKSRTNDLRNPKFSRSHTFCFQNSSSTGGARNSGQPRSDNGKFSLSSSDATPACSPQDAKGRKAAEVSRQTQSQLDLSIRENWKPKAKLEVYSVSRQRWFQGVVTKVLSAGKIEVLYRDSTGRGGKKLVNRMSRSDVRPLESMLGTSNANNNTESKIKKTSTVFQPAANARIGLTSSTSTITVATPTLSMSASSLNTSVTSAKDTASNDASNRSINANNHDNDTSGLNNASGTQGLNTSSSSLPASVVSSPSRAGAGVGISGAHSHGSKGGAGSGGGSSTAPTSSHTTPNRTRKMRRPPDSKANSMRQRAYIWGHVNALCRDPHPVVADAARSLVKFIFKLAAPDSAIRRIHSVPVRLGNRARGPSAAMPSIRGARLTTVLSQEDLSQKKDTIKPGSQGAAERKTPPTPDRPARNTSPVTNGIFDDERRTNILWTLPDSDVYSRGCAYFSQCLMQDDTADDDDDGAIDRQWRATRNIARLRRAQAKWEQALGSATPVKPFDGGWNFEKKGDEKKSPSQMGSLYAGSRGDEKASNLTTTRPRQNNKISPTRRWWSPASPEKNRPRTDSGDSTGSGSGVAEVSFEERTVLNAGHSEVSHVVFHPYEKLLVAAHPRDQITVWDYAKRSMVNRFSNGNHARESQITGLSFVNDLHISLLIAASDDGAVRVWRQPHEEGCEALVTAWAAAPSMPRGGGHMEGLPGLVTDWNQEKGCLSTAGNSGKIRLWNVNSEKLAGEISLPKHRHQGFVVTSMHSDLSGNVLVASDNKGVVRRFDLRESMTRCTMLYTHAQSSYTVKVQMQRSHPGLLVSASQNSQVIVYDSRGTSTVSDSKSTERLSSGLILRFQSHDRFPLDVFATHDYAPVVATGSRHQFVNLIDLRGGGRRIKRLRYHEGFLGQRLGPVTALAFHQHDLLLACGCNDPYISTYAGRIK